MKFSRIRTISCVAVALALSAAWTGVAQATVVVPITFSGPADYDNTANTVIAGPTPVNNQASGLFRDEIWWSISNGQPRVGSGDYINRGNSLILVGISAVPGPGPYTALNFTGPAVSGGQSYLSVYDTTPADHTTTKNLFDAQTGLVISADVLFVVHNTSGGVVALYNEGQDGLALLASNGSGANHDFPKLSLVWQSVGQGITLDSVNLPAATFVSENWYRVTMGLTVSGDTWTVDGTFQNHVIGTDPTSALGSLITTISDTGSLSDPDASARILTNPGEVGIMAMANEGISLPDNVGVSVTNFGVTPEPATLVLLGIGGIGMWLKRRRTK